MHMQAVNTRGNCADGAEHPIPIGQIVRALRLARGFHQVPFAKALGISQGHLSKIERGQIKLAADSWERGVLALAVGTPLRLTGSPERDQRFDLRYVLALAHEERIGTLELLAGDDGRVPIFEVRQAALFAAGIFGRVGPSACVIPVWPDFAKAIDDHGAGTAPVSTPYEGDSISASFHRELRDELEAATNIARTWLLRMEASGEENLKIAVSVDHDIAAFERKLDELETQRLPAVEHPKGSLVIFDAPGKEVLWPPTN